MENNIYSYVICFLKKNLVRMNMYELSMQQKNVYVNFTIIVSTILNFVIYKNKHDDDNHLTTNINNI